MQSALPSPRQDRRQPQLWLCVTFSLALHASLAVPWLYSRLAPHERPETRQLVLDLAGLESQHQVERQVQKVQPPREAEKNQPQPRVATHSETMAHTSAAEVATSKAQEVARQEEQKPLPAPQTASQDEQTVVEQHVVRQESEETLMKRYLAALKKNIQSHLAYPTNARDQGDVGATQIRFTLTEAGEIQPGSLSIQTSSGSAMLDASALKAAQAAAPFLPPPRRMSVSVGLSFFRES